MKNQHDKNSEHQKQVFKIFYSRFFNLYLWCFWQTWKDFPLAPRSIPVPLILPVIFSPLTFVTSFFRLFIHHFVCSFVRSFHCLLQFLFVCSSICCSFCSFVRYFVFQSMSLRESPANGTFADISRTKHRKKNRRQKGKIATANTH